MQRFLALSRDSSSDNHLDIHPVSPRRDQEEIDQLHTLWRSRSIKRQPLALPKEFGNGQTHLHQRKVLPNTISRAPAEWVPGRLYAKRSQLGCLRPSVGIEPVVEIVSFSQSLAWYGMITYCSASGNTLSRRCIV